MGAADRPVLAQRGPDDADGDWLDPRGNPFARWTGQEEFGTRLVCRDGGDGRRWVGCVCGWHNELRTVCPTRDRTLSLDANRRVFAGCESRSVCLSDVWAGYPRELAWHWQLGYRRLPERAVGYDARSGGNGEVDDVWAQP